MEKKANCECKEGVRRSGSYVIQVSSFEGASKMYGCIYGVS